MADRWQEIAARHEQQQDMPPHPEIPNGMVLMARALAPTLIATCGIMSPLFVVIATKIGWLDFLLGALATLVAAVWCAAWLALAAWLWNRWLP